MKQRLWAFLTFFSLILISVSARAIAYESVEGIKWKGVQTFKIDGDRVVSRLSFDGAYYPYLDVLPTFIKNYAVHTSNAKVSCVLQDEVYIPLTVEESSLLENSKVSDTIIPVCEMMITASLGFLHPLSIL